MLDDDALVRGAAVAIEIVGAHVPLVGVRDVQRAAVSRDRDAVRPRLQPRDRLDRPRGRDVVHAVEVEIALIERREQRVREIHVPVAAHDDVVGRVEAFALEPLRQHFDSAVPVGPRHTPRLVFTRVEPALGVERVAVRAVGVFTKHRGRATRHVPVETVPAVVAEEKIALSRPDGPLASGKPGRDLLDLQGREVLRGQK